MNLQLFPAAVLLLLAWGVLAFGAEFTWAYAPLLVFSVATGLLGWMAASRAGAHATTSSRVRQRALALALGAVILAAAVPVVPLPPSLVETMSPARDAVHFDALYAEASMREAPGAPDAAAARPLSIAPSRTWLGLAFLAAFAVLLLGVARGLGAVGAVTIARGIVLLGVVAAFLEIFQKASGSTVIYGLFEPRQPGAWSAPIVNRNHTAGWLVMALSLSLGHLAGGMARGMRGVKPAWRERLLWFGSGDAAETILTAFAIAVMAIAIVLTESRSGSLCLLLATLLFAWWGVQRQASASRRMLATTHLAFVVAAAAVLGGADAVGRRFSAAGAWEDMGGRLGVWQDTLRIVSDFPLVGTGLNTFGIAMLHYQTSDRALLFIESHNDYLQLAAEGGWLLGVPILALLVVFVAQVRRRFKEGADDTRTYWLRAGAVTGLCAIAFQEIFDFTLQMPGATVLFVVLAAIAVHRPRAAKVGSQKTGGR